MPARRLAVVVLALLCVVGAIAVLRMRFKSKRVAAQTLPSAMMSATPPSSAGVADAASSAFVRPSPPDDEEPQTVADQRARLFRRMHQELGLSDDVLDKVKAIFEGSPMMSQGNPKITKHPMKRSECFQARDRAGLLEEKELAKVAENESICGARYMVPVGKNAEPGFKPEICIDQYEFPDMPCEYPVTFVSARQAAELCSVMGKRMCDAHEWEGACAGSLRPAEEEYLFDRPRRLEMEFFKNKEREKVWAYGPEKDHSKCATASHKSPKCGGGGFDTCGTNTYPTGSFPACVSAFGVYDQHGNAAEHMNLPLKPEELTSRGGSGMTEMKGSWFIFLREEAHEDDCRWRAPSWHESKVKDLNSHLNYHLGFRCCKSLSRA